jgi:hypothetical protein
MDDLDRARRRDQQFLRAIAIGTALGVPALWLVLTVTMAAAADQSWVVAAGYSALPAVFCGPFVGGLFTTALASRDDEGSDVQVLGRSM